jgi:hypothetical protein
VEPSSRLYGAKIIPLSSPLDQEVSDELRGSGLEATFRGEHLSHSARIGGVPAQTDSMRQTFNLPDGVQLIAGSFATGSFRPMD